MNERVKQLAEQAAGNFTQTFVWEYCLEIDRNIFKKFAELIVRECADLFEVEFGDEKLTGNDVSWLLKKHFGVEE